MCCLASFSCLCLRARLRLTILVVLAGLPFSAGGGAAGSALCACALLGPRAALLQRSKALKDVCMQVMCYCY